jgi:hypothetical protein
MATSSPPYRRRWAAAGSSLPPPSKTQFEVTMALAFVGASAGPRRRSSNSGLADALVGSQACSFAGRTVLTVVHEATRVPSFRAITPPKLPEHRARTGLTPDFY